MFFQLEAQTKGFAISVSPGLDSAPGLAGHSGQCSPPCAPQVSHWFGTLVLPGQRCQLLSPIKTCPGRLQGCGDGDTAPSAAGCISV